MSGLFLQAVRFLLSFFLATRALAEPDAALHAPDAASYTPDALERDLLPLHNRLRAQHGAPPLAWNRTLADASQRHAGRCRFEHRSAGENLAGGYANASAAVSAWAAESGSYDFGSPSLQGVHGEVVGHFTQMVWRNSTGLGCAAQECRGLLGDGGRSWFLVCRYWPVGNIDDPQWLQDNVKPQGDEGGGAGAVVVMGRWWWVGVVMAGGIVMA